MKLDGQIIKLWYKKGDLSVKEIEKQNNNSFQNNTLEIAMTRYESESIGKEIKAVKRR